MNVIYYLIDVAIHVVVLKVIFFSLNIGSPEFSFDYFESFLCFSFVTTLSILNLVTIKVVDVEEMD